MNAHSKPSFGAGSPQWPSERLAGWAGSGGFLVQGGGGGGGGGGDWSSPPRSPAGNHVLVKGSSRGSSSSPEKDAEETDHPDQDGANHLPESDTPHAPRHRRGDIREDQKLRRLKALDLGAGLCGALSKALDDSVSSSPTSSSSSSCSSIADQVYQSPRAKQAAAPQEPPVSKVPLRLQIKVRGQSSGLGLSIAGGKGSLTYREHDESIFISRVSEGGPSQKAGIHVGDRLLEVNGLDTAGMTHHEAVRALRNAGSCVRMKVLREKRLPAELQCDVEMNAQWKLFKQEPDARTITKFQFQVKKNTVTIPRIILTHPSISDDDVDGWSQGSRGGGGLPFSASDSADVHIQSGNLKSPFYPP